MKRTLTSTAPDTVRARPHVSGQTTRYKAEPAKLTALSARVMCASGSFTSEQRAERFRPGRFIGALALLVAAGTFALAHDPRSAEQQNARVIGMQLADAEHLFSLGAGDYSRPAESTAEVTLDAQDRFEIDRMFRLTAAASSGLAPASGDRARARADATR